MTSTPKIAIKTPLPTVTIVTPSFNQGSYLQETIESVLAQNYPNLQYIIMDGGSTDNSVDIIKRYEKHLAFWVSARDKGQCDAINQGWRLGSGQIVSWINADDLYEPYAVMEGVEALQNNPKAGVACGSVAMFQGRDSSTIFYVEKSPCKSLKACLSSMTSPGTTAAFVRRQALEEVGYLDISLHYWIDPELWFRIALKWEVANVPHVWYRFRIHPDAKSATRTHFAEEHIAIARRYVNSSSNLPLVLRSAARDGLITALLRTAWLYSTIDRKRATEKLHQALRFSPLSTVRLSICRRELARGLAEYLLGHSPLWASAINLRNYMRPRINVQQ